MKFFSNKVGDNIQRDFEIQLFDELEKKVLYEQPYSGNYFVFRMRVDPRWMTYVPGERHNFEDGHKIISWDDVMHITYVSSPIKMELRNKKHLI